MAASFPMPSNSDVAHEASPPTYRPSMSQFARENTTYSGQNLWMSSPDKSMGNGVPATMSDAHYRISREFSPKRPRTQASTELSNQYFQQYMKLMNRMAYRYPNPGPPRLRNGNVGANWRHIRQVLGYGGNNICFIDGVVKQYDLNNVNQDLAGRRPYQRANQAEPLYAVNQHDVNGYKQHVAMETEKQTYRPWQSSLPPIAPNYHHHYQ